MEYNVVSEAQPECRGYVDVFRGLLIAHMALDHASLMFNAGRGGEELAAAAPAPYGDILQFLTRFTGVPVAPGLAGFMVALTSIVLMAWPCVWCYRKKRDRPNLFTRYL